MLLFALSEVFLPKLNHHRDDCMLGELTVLSLDLDQCRIAFLRSSLLNSVVEQVCTDN